MRFAMAMHGTTFSTRPRGAELLQSLQDSLRDDRVVLDFEHVLGVSHSFADAFYAELVTATTLDVNVVGASPDVRHTLDRALAHRRGPAEQVDVEALISG